MIADELAPDLERRFGALRRLYGDAGYANIRAARVAVVGLVQAAAVDDLLQQLVGLVVVEDEADRHAVKRSVRLYRAPYLVDVLSRDETDLDQSTQGDVDVWRLLRNQLELVAWLIIAILLEGFTPAAFSFFANSPDFCPLI